eukprot:gnl/Hemi2/8050_TR2770_c0_g1_i1.p1 gnl/Hemi2/8050_TR2770_c0_g1~~gnl/Hemi2/8050_TR2770_c0_g1_i1.p1  ORF type:complete len:192 (+),score=25.28 gnl/Hemi2/8050_TR2770_c0_g1_i1:85-576(+)
MKAVFLLLLLCLLVGLSAASRLKSLAAVLAAAKSGAKSSGAAVAKSGTEALYPCDPSEACPLCIQMMSMRAHNMYLSCESLDYRLWYPQAYLDYCRQAQIAQCQMVHEAVSANVDFMAKAKTCTTPTGSGPCPPSFICASLSLPNRPPLCQFDVASMGVSISS